MDTEDTAEGMADMAEEDMVDMVEDGAADMAEDGVAADTEVMEDMAIVVGREWVGRSF